MNIAIKPRVLFPKIDHTITDPNDYGLWEKLISAMVEHYKARRVQKSSIGKSRTSRISANRAAVPISSRPEGYVRYYKHTALAIRKADQGAKVGGPALANPDSAIFPELLRSAQQDHLPLDFVSWHIYNNDPAGHSCHDRA